MQRSSSLKATPRSFDVTVRDLMQSRDAGEDPRQTIVRLNHHIVACQLDGMDLPPSMLRLSRLLAAACVAQAQVEDR